MKIISFSDAANGSSTLNPVSAGADPVEIARN
jgi:hypothetical protein